MNKRIMIQGTGSSVGKSLMVIALCRIFKQDGIKVAPFKSQNMALNSYITALGEEMGRAQVAQAEACGVLPSARMNPILLKPTSDKKSQVILNGKVLKNMTACEYHEFKPQLKEYIKDSYNALLKDYELIVIEGAGSPAEINLRENDLVNMGMAEIADAPVILVGDIDKGGVFASIVGTLMLLSEEERNRVKGVIINKFRGDLEILKPGIKMLEDIIKIPVIGVIPYMYFQIDDEDGFLSKEFMEEKHRSNDINIEIIQLPHISNFTDFNVFHLFPDVSFRYIQEGEPISDPDIIILPGSKNTIEDIIYLRKSGLEEQILKHHHQGKSLIGICGGYQMLGKEINDPKLAESQIPFTKGLGILDTYTTFEDEKSTYQVKAQVSSMNQFTKYYEDEEIKGYEIHMGKTEHGAMATPFIEITERLGDKVEIYDGAINLEGNVWGTYIHGIFDNTSFTRKFLNIIREKKGLKPINEVPLSYQQAKENEYDRLADFVREHLDIDFIDKLLKK